MKSIFISSILSLVMLAALCLSCNKKEDPQIDLSAKGHPRILLFEGEEEQIRDLIDSDEIWKKMHFAILEESNKILSKPTLERVMIGRRLLSTSRELLRRAFFLSYSYRMTGDVRYLNKAEKELYAVSTFSDWNPSHFLDVAEMTMGVAIGYDWLFEDLSQSTREAARNAIISKGINPSKNNDYNWFLNSENNWNQVCNAGMVFGALAIQEDQPTLATEMIARAMQSVPMPMEAYQPDGAYPEGYGYWGYGTTFNVLLLSVLEKYNGNENRLSTTPGFLETGDFLKHMLTPTGSSFNWGDNTVNTNLKPAMFWIAQKTNDPSILWSEKKFLEIEDYSKFKWLNSLPAIMIWSKDLPISNIEEPSEKFWYGQGANPVAMMRTSWTDPDALFLGFKAGSPSVNHGHMDVGSFMFEADDVRWAGDLGQQNYESLESLGMKIFGKGQDAERWTVFRMNTYSHNVLIINDQQQQVSGYAKIDRYSDVETFMFSISDISSVYFSQLKEAQRGVGIKAEGYGIIRDEVETLDKPTKLRWNMLTYSDVELGDKEATLTSQGRKLVLKVQGPDNVEMKTWSTAPTNNYDAENPGTIMVGFEVLIPANTTQSIEVLLIPEKAVAQADFSNKPLNEW